MKNLLTILFLTTAALYLAACNQGEGGSKDFGQFSWGMTMDEVLKMEEENGNSIAKQREKGSAEIDVSYYDQVLIDKKVMIRYTFARQMERPNDDENLPAILQFEDYILVRVYVEFTDAFGARRGSNPWNHDEIYFPLEEKYGKGSQGDNEDIFWTTDRSVIVLDNFRVLHYYARTEILKEFLAKEDRDL
jgi:predicted small secreted protein